MPQNLSKLDRVGLGLRARYCSQGPTFVESSWQDAHVGYNVWPQSKSIHETLASTEGTLDRMH